MAEEEGAGEEGQQQRQQAAHRGAGAVEAQGGHRGGGHSIALESMHYSHTTVTICSLCQLVDRMVRDGLRDAGGTAVDVYKYVCMYAGGTAVDVYKYVCCATWG